MLSLYFGSLQLKQTLQVSLNDSYQFQVIAWEKVSVSTENLIKDFHYTETHSKVPIY